MKKNTSTHHKVNYVIATVGFIIALAAWHKLTQMMKKPAAAAPTMQLMVSVAKPYQTSVRSYIESVGQCTAYNRVVLVPQVEGTLEEVRRPNGGFVTANEILFRIDDRPYLAAVHQSEAQLTMDQAQHQLNVLQLKRSEELRSGNFVSQQEFDSYKTNVEASQAKLDLDQATYDLKCIDLEHCTLVAPFSGELSKSSVDAHSFVARGTSLAVLNQLQPIYVDSFLSERHLSELLAAQYENPDDISVEAHLIDIPQVYQIGKLIFRGNEVDKSTGTFDIRAEFDNGKYQFWPGRGIDLKIYYKTLKDVLLVPECAIHESPKGSFVYVINEKGLAEMHYVTTGQSYDGWIIIQGLKKDITVIADGHALLAPGIPVQASSTVEVPESLKK